MHRFHTYLHCLYSVHIVCTLVYTLYTPIHHVCTLLYTLFAHSYTPFSHSCTPRLYTSVHIVCTLLCTVFALLYTTFVHFCTRRRLYTHRLYAICTPQAVHAVRARAAARRRQSCLGRVLPRRRRVPLQNRSR